MFELFLLMKGTNHSLSKMTRPSSDAGTFYFGPLIGMSSCEEVQLGIDSNLFSRNECHEISKITNTFADRCMCRDAETGGDCKSRDVWKRQGCKLCGNKGGNLVIGDESSNIDDPSSIWNGVTCEELAMQESLFDFSDIQCDAARTAAQTFCSCQHTNDNANDNCIALRDACNPEQDNCCKGSCKYLSTLQTYACSEKTNDKTKSPQHKRTDAPAVHSSYSAEVSRPKSRPTKPPKHRKTQKPHRRTKVPVKLISDSPSMTPHAFTDEPIHPLALLTDAPYDLPTTSAPLTQSPVSNMPSSQAPSQAAIESLITHVPSKPMSIQENTDTQLPSNMDITTSPSEKTKSPSIPYVGPSSSLLPTTLPNGRIVPSLIGSDGAYIKIHNVFIITPLVCLFL
jgi:hypothetical protein